MAYRIVDKTIDDFQVGDKLTFSKTVTEADVVVFGAISGDQSPQYVNAHYARSTTQGERIAHGMLIASLATAAMHRLIAPGSYLEGCEFRFLTPVRLGDTITATVEVVEKDQVGRRLKLRAVCINQRDEAVLEGAAIHLMSSERREG